MALQHHSFRAAAVQAAPVFLDLDASIDKAIALVEEAANAGAELVAFPETFLPGYPWHIWLGAPAWAFQFTGRYFDNSLEYGTPEADRLAAAARDNHIMVVMGLSERYQASLYIAQWIIDADGRTIATRRKLKPTHVERTVFGEGDGSDLAVHDTDLGRLGALCCWEHLQPLSKYAMYAQNEQIHIAAWPSFSSDSDESYALGAEVNTSASRVYAVEGGTFVIAPCATVSTEMVELLCTDDMKRQILPAGGGHARIFGPDGRMLHEPLDPSTEGIVYADIDTSVISVAKAAADPAGHYARLDVTRLWIDKTPGDRVITATPAGAGRARSIDRSEFLTDTDLADFTLLDPTAQEPA
ncbi:carbon-nitrogen hydrolase family protein [Rhodococcus pseudokoreensis]|uniref:Carbon-nitrogen hydrolase family protein n=1 Tax=Rhodococcus pseudokoreensis TaxID=2811421 RepID=A0A974W3F9_9NOCA|nr:carbon-nitrogen hydrolase family protein [Rhodococcus pseudokoreensis]QSE90628.1 carbon-nitrogen hydrolase family protein [Rhodococcus pseudokoreensis]